MTHPNCLLCGSGLNNTQHKLQFLRLAFNDEEVAHRRFLVRVAINCYVNHQHYKKWVPLETLMQQIKAGEVGGRNIDLEPEQDMADVIIHLGGKPLLRWDASIAEPVESTL